MIDLETLGTSPDCTVLTIGGVKFDPNQVSNPYQEFYYRFDVDEQLEKGRTTLQSTLDWWARQEKSVRDEALGDEDRTPVLDV
jgi:DNA polymerase III epsilon subunit-like protein